MASKKILIVIVAIICIVTCFTSVANAATYNAYDGTISSTYTTYFDDILNNIGIDEDYVALRNDQYEYSLIVGDLVIDGNVISSNSACRVYSFTTNSGYNATYTYDIYSIDECTVNCGDEIVYSNLGNYPNFIERSVNFEFIQTIILLVVGLCFIIRNIFNIGKR